MSKAAVTSLVNDLAERGLVEEGPVERLGTVGRPGTEVRIDPSHVAGIGVELNVDYIAVSVLDLGGAVRFSSSVPMPFTTDESEGIAEGTRRSYIPSVVIDRTARQLEEALDVSAESGLWIAGATIAQPGAIDYDTASVRFASNLGWSDIPLGAELARRLRAGHPVIALENDAKLSALAEAPLLAERGIDDLVYLTGDMGVGAGIISEGRLVRGWSGFSGEVGHMTIDLEGPLCRCGRRGCWEALVGFGTVLDALDPDDPVRSGHLSLRERREHLRRLLAEDDPRLLAQFAALTANLIRGVGVLVDVLNPRSIVLGGYFGYFADVLVEPLQAALSERRLDDGGQVEVSRSTFGSDAAAIGGAVVALERILDDPLLVPMLSEAPDRATARPAR